MMQWCCWTWPTLVGRVECSNTPSKLTDEPQQWGCQYRTVDASKRKSSGGSLAGGLKPHFKLSKGAFTMPIAFIVLVAHTFHAVLGQRASARLFIGGCSSLLHLWDGSGTMKVIEWPILMQHHEGSKWGLSVHLGSMGAYLHSRLPQAPAHSPKCHLTLQSATAIIPQPRRVPHRMQRYILNIPCLIEILCGMTPDADRDILWGLSEKRVHLP
eukprot:2871174-Amphidinium_carterae.1